MNINKKLLAQIRKQDANQARARQETIDLSVPAVIEAVEKARVLERTVITVLSINNHKVTVGSLYFDPENNKWWYRTLPTEDHPATEEYYIPYFSSAESSLRDKLKKRGFYLISSEDYEKHGAKADAGEPNPVSKHKCFVNLRDGGTRDNLNYNPLKTDLDRDSLVFHDIIAMDEAGYVQYGRPTPIGEKDIYDNIERGSNIIGCVYYKPMPLEGRRIGKSHYGFIIYETKQYGWINGDKYDSERDCLNALHKRLDDCNYRLCPHNVGEDITFRWDQNPNIGVSNYQYVNQPPRWKGQDPAQFERAGEFKYTILETLPGFGSSLFGWTLWRKKEGKDRWIYWTFDTLEEAQYAAVCDYHDDLDLDRETDAYFAEQEKWHKQAIGG